jgi:uncharacterized protein (DUF1810 family)
VADRHNLQRFIDAQLRAGRKSSHWMWFVFPQVAGLGHSPMAQRYAIQSLEEARAYLAHPVLGARLAECTQLVLDVSGRSISEILGYPDDLKLRSSMTLFGKAAGTAGSLFEQALTRYFGGEPDSRTLELLGAR